MNTQQAIDIEKIVAGFTEQDNEAVYAEVEALDKKVPIHGFTAFISKYLPPDFDPEVLARRRLNRVPRTGRRGNLGLHNGAG